MHELKTQHDVDNALKAPLAIIFKHSTECPISANADREMRAFLQVHKAAPVYLIDVLRSKSLSQEVERRTGIRHESPQVIILLRGHPMWHASHFDITATDLEQALVSLS